ncbi:MAG: hypothetical protein KAJ39_05060 [Gammaproteobacteria bacterium]|nr:hypothetical protein [Gammaproteobacteria bacterium]
MINFEIGPQYYEEIHNAITVVDNECKLNFLKSGIKTEFVDPANVLLISMNIPKKMFESYNIETEIEIGYIFCDLICFDGETNHKFEIVQTDGDGIRDPITTLTLYHDIFVNTIVLPKINNIRHKPNYQKLNLKCQFKLNVDFLKKVVNHSNEYVCFDVKNSQLTCNEDTIWKTQPINVDTKEVGRSLYSKDYLIDIVEAIPDNVELVEMSIGVDYPCTIKFNICDGMVPIMYLLSPRLEID